MRVLLTGASGLVGTRVLAHLLRDRRVEHVVALVRSRLPAVPPALRTRVTFVTGDVTRAGLGLDRHGRAATARLTHAIHAAADTTFSRPLAAARRVNAQGTRHVLDVAEHGGVRRFVHVSTAYVAGTSTGRIHECATGAPDGFVNAYERSKHEAEALVRACGIASIVLRPSTIICDDRSGTVSQCNAVHRALRVMHAGLAPLMPGGPDTPVDFITAAWVAHAIVHIGLADASAGTYHLCAGGGAATLGDVIERAFALWGRDAEWRRRGILPPVLTDLATFRDFERAVADTGDARLSAVARSLSHFAPQMAFPKRFDTTLAEAALGRPAPPVSAFLDPVLRGFAGRARRTVAA